MAALEGSEGTRSARQSKVAMQRPHVNESGSNMQLRGVAAVQRVVWARFGCGQTKRQDAFCWLKQRGGTFDAKPQKHRAFEHGSTQSRYFIGPSAIESISLNPYYIQLLCLTHPGTQEDPTAAATATCRSDRVRHGAKAFQQHCRFSPPCREHPSTAQ